MKQRTRPTEDGLGSGALSDCGIDCLGGDGALHRTEGLPEGPKTRVPGCRLSVTAFDNIVFRCGSAQPQPFSKPHHSRSSLFHFSASK